jgi:hypothetical protein
MEERPNIEEDFSGWLAAIKRLHAQPVTVSGPAGDLTVTYQQIMGIRDDLNLAYTFLTDPPEGDDYAIVRDALLDRLLESEMLVRLFLNDEDVETTL